MSDLATAWRESNAKNLVLLDAIPNDALKASEKAIATFLDDSEAADKVKGWRGRPTTYLSYFVAHEAHHRGLALVALRAHGTKLAKEITYGIWYWRERVR